MNRPYYLPALGIINALGCGIDEVTQGLLRGDTSGMVLEDDWLPGAPARVGRVQATLPEIPSVLSACTSRNNRLLLAALDQIRPAVDAALERFGRDRIGIVLGTSTSGIAEGEAAIAALRNAGNLPCGYDYVQQELGSPALFLSRFLDLGGPAYCVSTACTSSAKAFVSARRLLRCGLCDAVLVGGVDSLCKLTLNGFAALESISTDLCNPMSRNRKGINIGEGAALFLMSRDESEIAFLGAGESSDAYHISAPHPEGAGAEAAMRGALADAGLSAGEVDYLNMHATATRKNDEMESRAISRVFPVEALKHSSPRRRPGSSSLDFVDSGRRRNDDSSLGRHLAEGIPASGTKPLTGHTLGAAGATELGLCWLALRAGRLPPHVWDGEADPALPTLRLVEAGQEFSRTSNRMCMSNSFAFGGSNASLLIGDAR